MADTTVSHTNGHTVPETECRGAEKKLETSVSALSSSGSPDGTPDANGTKSEETDVSIALNAANIEAVPSLIKEINALSGDLDSDDPTARLKLMAKAKSFEPSLHCALTAGTVKEVWTHVAKINRPFKVADVAKEKNIEPALLARLVRHVSSMGYITEIDQDTYQATDFIKSMAFPFINAGYPCISGACLNALGQFHEWADINSWKDATDGFEKSNDSALLVDIGGSFGHDIGEFCRKFPDALGRLILQDLPVVIDQITSLDNKIERMKYDFYTEQPIKGARAYYMHSVLHDWSDETCLKILSQVKAAMKPGYSKLLINENVIPNTGSQWEATALDIMMLTLLASRERT
ncbi:O-methyltransferase B [Fusarium denticulatum]|uniref:O-methyltransferase B n=1 Tax=Fusarium denticulatum TaxID=48507 RepID=A0A8H5U2J9_9HYPO|nr:O-methyltransferase B [Fusarium denticulatum]